MNNFYYCPICNTRLKSRCAMGAHCLKYHKEETIQRKIEYRLRKDQKVFKCSICEREFDSERKLSGHKGSHFNKRQREKQKKEIEKKKIYCKFCGKESDGTVGFGGHVAWCEKNPNVFNAKEKLSISNKGKKASKETRLKISIHRKKFLDENPHKVPYLLNHSSKESWPEKIFEAALIKHGILGWKKQFRFYRFALDFAFPDQKVDIEIDGQTHIQESVRKKDFERDELLSSEGWIVKRYTSHQVLSNVSYCIIDFLKIVDPNKETNNILFIRKKGLDSAGIELRKDIKRQEIEVLKKKILESDINFSEYGWVSKVSKIIGILPNKGGYWMKKHMPSFYLEKCFKIKN